MTQPAPSTIRRGRPRVEGLAERRREEILNAAALVFASRGFAKTDIQVIADRLKLGKGTIYRYFPTKQALFLAALDRGMRLLTEYINQEVEPIGDPLDRIAGGTRAYLTYFDEHPEYVELIIQERAVFKDRKKPTYFRHSESNLKPWLELIKGLIRDGRVRDVPPEWITDFLSDLLYGTMFTNYFAGRRKSFEVQTGELLDIVFRGIMTPGEQERNRPKKTRGVRRT